MKRFINWIRSEEAGQGMVEYALIIALLAVVLIGALTALSGGIGDIFTKIKDELAGAEAGATPGGGSGGGNNSGGSGGGDEGDPDCEHVWDESGHWCTKCEEANPESVHYTDNCDGVCDADRCDKPAKRRVSSRTFDFGILSAEVAYCDKCHTLDAIIGSDYAGVHYDANRNFSDKHEW